MAVVISGTNNSDKITATDGLIDLLSSVNFASEVSVPSFKVGSDIQIGNAGIITATTLVGNVQGNINHTSNLLLQISGSEKFRVGTSGQLGIGGANYGTSGQVLTSGGSGSAATWSTLTGVTINNNANNRIITGNTGTTLDAESTLTYDGNQLKFGSGSGPTSSGGYYDDIKIDNSDTASGEHGGTGIEFISGNQSWAGLIFSDSDSAQQGYVKYSHQNDYTTIAAAGQERLRLLANNIQAINCTGALTLPLGTTAQRPTAATGMIRYNSTETELEMYNGTEWLAIKTVPIL